MDLSANQITAIIGPSGCGKSTFIRCLNRMHETVPGARVTGDIFLEESSIYQMPATEVRRRIGMVFREPNPFPTLSIFDNLTLALRLGGMRNHRQLRERAERSLRVAGLWDEVKDKLNQNALVLSLGQQQRLCIARALALEPDVLLLDEPASALDPVSTLQIEELMEQIKKDLTIVIVTHNLQQAARIADTTAFFLDGELVEWGDTSLLFTKPSDRRTEDYIAGRFG